jgi:hypothetical protein
VQLRNPFAFGAVEQHLPISVGKAAAAESIPPIEAPPEPNLVLLGLAEDGLTRTAMIGFGDDLVMATEGETIVGRYRVAKVAADAIELTDLVSGTTRRLFLKSQASPL